MEVNVGDKITLGGIEWNVLSHIHHCYTAAASRSSSIEKRHTFTPWLVACTPMIDNFNIGEIVTWEDEHVDLLDKDNNPQRIHLKWEIRKEKKNGHNADEGSDRGPAYRQIEGHGKGA